MALFGEPPHQVAAIFNQTRMLITFIPSAATNNQTGEGVAIKKVTNVFSKKILAKRALREIKLLQHFRGHRNVSIPCSRPNVGMILRQLGGDTA